MAYDKLNFKDFVSQYDPEKAIAQRNAEAKARKEAREVQKKLSPFKSFLKWSVSHAYGPQDTVSLEELAKFVKACKYNHEKGQWANGVTPLSYQRGLEEFARYKIFMASLESQ